MVWFILVIALSAALVAVAITAWRTAMGRDTGGDTRRHALIARTHRTIVEAGGVKRAARRRAREAEWAGIIAEHEQREAAREAAIRTWAARADPHERPSGAG